MYELWQLLATKRLRAFASLAGLVNAYRVGDEEAVLLRACEALILGCHHMRTRPTPTGTRISAAEQTNRSKYLDGMKPSTQSGSFDLAC